MKQYVFVHVDAIPSDKYFEDLTDAEILKIRHADPGNTATYDSFEEFLGDFNSECCPDASFFYGRAIEMKD